MLKSIETYFAFLTNYQSSKTCIIPPELQLAINSIMIVNKYPWQEVTVNVISKLVYPKSERSMSCKTEPAFWMQLFLYVP